MKIVDIANSVYYNHLITCNLIASKMCALHGWEVTNFPKLILAERNGRYGNSQMTCYFWAADEALCQLNGLEAGQVFDILELEYDFDLGFLAELDLIKDL